MRVLLVEDDPMIGEAVHGTLKDAAYATDWVKNGQTAISTLDRQHYDLVVLDLGLPGRDGMDVLNTVRAAHNPVPLLIITARDGLDDRLRGLDGGADDYVLKPFEMAELLARMRAALRRKAGTGSPIPLLVVADLVRGMLRPITSLDRHGPTVRVTDSGPGIPPAERARVMEPFYRVLGSHEIGSGLGLAIVKAIADRNGADVRVDYADTQAGSGLCVSVHFPVPPA